MKTRLFLAVVGRGSSCNFVSVRNQDCVLVPTPAHGTSTGSPWQWWYDYGRGERQANIPQEIRVVR